MREGIERLNDTVSALTLGLGEELLDESLLVAVRVRIRGAKPEKREKEQETRSV